jgi:hypothetical protein
MLQVHFRWTNYNTQPTHDDKANINMINFFEDLKRIMNIHCKLKDIIFVNRKGVRKVLDLTTKKPLEETLSKVGIKCAYFEDLTTQEQIDFVKDAKIFISPHGSALTNIIFTHPNCKIVEISSRKNWFCDPLCHKHKNNIIAESDNCNSKSKFYKYDFIHQAILLNKKHYEYVCDEYMFVEPKSHHTKTNLVDTKTLLTFINEVNHRHDDNPNAVYRHTL